MQRVLIPTTELWSRCSPEPREARWSVMTKHDDGALNDLIVRVNQSLLVLDTTLPTEKKETEVTAAMGLYGHMRVVKTESGLSPRDSATLQWVMDRLRGRLRLLGEKV